MRRAFWLVLLLAGCGGPDSDPVDVAERFHAARVDGDDRGVYALLSDGDRAAYPLEAFPAELPPSATVDLLGWRDARIESSTLLGAENDTAAVVLQVQGAGRDTVRLVATHEPGKLLWVFNTDRVRWRVSMGLAEQALLDSLAVGLRDGSGVVDSAAVARAEAYLRAAERHPSYSRAADMDAAEAQVRRAEVAEALGIELRLTRTIDGVYFVDGRVRNPTASRINTLVLAVEDAAGTVEQFEVWDIGPQASTEIRRITSLQRSPLAHRVARIQVF